MYTLETLKKYPFFEDAAKNVYENLDLTNILDSLTGVISRQYMGEYARMLVKKNIPFAFVILDIDNFKLINDNYGHHVGDLVLAEIAKRLINYAGDDGLVGRYGGDEYIIIYLKDNSYDGVYKFLYGMYYEERVFRCPVFLEQCTPFITASMGAASYPINAKDFDDLFLCADKALYRGKLKGRNCFIVYLKEKHEFIDLNNIEKHVLYQAMLDLSDIVSLENGINNKIKRIIEYLKDFLRIGNAYFIDNEYKFFNDHNKFFRCDFNSLLGKNNIYQCHNRGDLDETNPDFAQELLEKDILSFVVIRVTLRNSNYGYLILADRRTQHIWQDEEISLGVFSSKLISTEIEINKK